METVEVLDVTAIEPKFKHPRIFEMFDNLPEGESFVIHNDHDPKPLYYQLLGERGEVFNWEYLEEGPEFWKVKIGKLKKGDKSTIGKLVAKDYRKAAVFKKFGLDFCCGGNKTVDDACREKGIDAVKVKQELTELENQGGNKDENYEEWDLGFLAEYIVNKHHKYVLEASEELFQHTQKVARVHGAAHPEVLKIAQLFINLANELTSHMNKEEQILFPYIKQLSEAKKAGEQLEQPSFGSIENPIRMMESEHDTAGDLMGQIEELSSGFNPPKGACMTYRVSYFKLQEFQDDLHRHIHLENNILFPKAIELEKEVLK